MTPHDRAHLDSHVDSRDAPDEELAVFEGELREDALEAGASEQDPLGISDKGRRDMASSGKKKTTMAKLARESTLRERRLIKQAKKEARKQASRDRPNSPGSALDATTAEATQPGSRQVPLEPVVEPLAQIDEETLVDGVNRE